MMQRALHKLLAAVVATTLTCVTAGSAFAAQITDLIAERATQEYGPAMPANGRFSIRMDQSLPDSGEYIQEFWIDRDTGQFIANIITDRGGIQRVWGLAVLTVPVPVVNRRIMPNEIIAATDVETIEMPWARVHAFAVTEVAQLQGMQVRRMLSPGRPVHHQSVIPPIVVSRGQRVTIELQHGPLKLSAIGKAIGDAHKGQEVRVVNLASNKTIIAIALSDGVVEAQF
ncbi:hypothetical protein NBRC116601_32020 [Cognatishimia sp. WU-CL00825]|uniref:flagellar basal body P-ring formation chaperone FlgA n=1 Tax=Cognatishimia sp. WU-CL00825 TaxID=3127658 RepID=UPI00310A6DE0